MINLNQFPFYNYCFDEEQLENLYKKFNNKRDDYSNNSKTFIQVIYVNFCSELSKTYKKIDTTKNADYFIKQLLREIDKSIKTCENLLTSNPEKDFKLFVNQIMKMNGWMIDQVKFEFRELVDYIKTYEANEIKVKFEIPSQYSDIFRNQMAEQFFFETLTELDAKPNTYGFNAKISAVFSNKGFKNSIFKHELLQKKFVAFINDIYPNSIKNNSKLSNPDKYEMKIQQIINNYAPNKSE